MNFIRMAYYEGDYAAAHAYVRESRSVHPVPWPYRELVHAIRMKFIRTTGYCSPHAPPYLLQKCLPLPG